MNHTYRVLKKDLDFFTAALSQDRVAVWHVIEDEDHLIDYGGVVEGYSPIAIRIAGNRYLRSTLEFRVRIIT